MTMRDPVTNPHCKIVEASDLYSGVRNSDAHPKLMVGTATGVQRGWDGWRCDRGAKGMGWVALRQGCEGDGMGGAVG